MNKCKVETKGRVVIVTHCETDAKKVTDLVNEITNHVKKITGSVIIVHNAEDMTFADESYRDAFLAMEKELADRVERTICFIPNAVPRILARTISLLTGRDWEIFSKRDKYHAVLDQVIAENS